MGEDRSALKAGPHLLVSILSLGRTDNVLQQLAPLPAWLSDCALELGMTCGIMVRNNDPNVDFSLVDARLKEISRDYPVITCRLFSGSPNLGFGRGHNENICSAPSDYALILNDDIGFPHIDWLSKGIQDLRANRKLALIGAAENPQHLNSSFGNGIFPAAAHLGALKYAEASVLLVNTAVFRELGMFNDQYSWAMCEDADLSLRAQQLGYRIEWMPMPHQHWRSTTFNSLPGQVKSSILEANRATLFANWRDSFAAGRVGRTEVFDIWSDGIGDTFCALPHFFAEWEKMTQQRRDAVVLNVRHTELIELFGASRPRITSFEDLDDLKWELRPEGISTIRSMRYVNFSLPFNIHALACAALGIPQADEAAGARLAANLRSSRMPSALNHDQPYCVLHVEFSRFHAGRGISPSGIRDLLRGCAEGFECVVLIGRERRLAEAITKGLPARIIDLQGRLCLTELAAVVANARYFAGIDSFPAHVAAAARVPSTIFFGAIHPLARVWNERLTWPLLAELPCIGCYHTHLEPSVPFCMRRDEACTTGLSPAQIRNTLSAMKHDAAHSWEKERLSFQSPQGRMLHVAYHHPSPPERMFRPRGPGNEQLSNLVYRLTEQTSELIQGYYKSTTIDKLAAQVKELESERFQARLQLEEARRTIRALQAAPPEPAPPTRLVQLADLSLQESDCRVARDEQWIDVESFALDPQIMVPDIHGLGARVYLRINYMASPGSYLQVFWASPGQNFAEDRSQVVSGSGGERIGDVYFDLAHGEVLTMRIDPLAGLGRCRFKATLFGAFELAPAEAPRQETAEIVDLIVPVTAAKRAARRLRSNGVVR